MRSETGDTIAAIATPPGRSALGIVRVSGKDCRLLVTKIFVARYASEIPSFRPVLGRIMIGENQYVDEALLTYYEAPHSYTREDVAEISCHGNPLILERVLLRIVSVGARLAMPGEFTYRAFLNGRLDLVQAEAVQDLIDSDSMHQVELALHQLEGRFSRELMDLRGKLLELVALMEGNIDFSEEQHYHFIHQEEAVAKLDRILEDLRKLLGTYERGRMIRDGFNVAIVGRPNVGKSSIFNSLLGEDRAIVTATPGTTRDYLRERVRLGNYLVNWLDTAGIREGQEEIEQEGIRRSRQVIEKADLIVFVVDGSIELQEEDLQLWNEMSGHEVLVVSNKADRAGYVLHRFGAANSLKVSALNGEGIEELLDVVRERIGTLVHYVAGDSVVANMRHRERLAATLSALERSREAVIKKSSEEITLVELHEALSSLGEITGEVTIDDLYQHIFSNFCIGK